MSDDKLTTDDFARAGFCVSGIKAWCEANGRDFRDLIRNGLPIEEARTMDDAFVQRALALKEASDGR